MAAESPDNLFFDLDRIKAIREEDLTLPPPSTKDRSSKHSIDRGNTNAARNLLVQIKEKDKEVQDFYDVTTEIVTNEGQENAADQLQELDNKNEALKRLQDRFNEALSKVPSSVLENLKTKDKEPPKLDFLTTVVKPMCKEMMTPAVTAPIMPPPPPIAPLKKRRGISSSKRFIQYFNPDRYSTNRKSCNHDRKLRKETCDEIFEMFDTWNDEDDLDRWYRTCPTYICRRTLVNMWKRWQSQKAGEEDTKDLNEECCYYKHPLMWASLKEAWVEFCERA